MLCSFKQEKELEGIRRSLAQYESTLTLYVSQASSILVETVSSAFQPQALHFEVPVTPVRKFVGRRALLDTIQRTLEQDSEDGHSYETPVAVLTGFGGAY